jgi:hypothetical protein
MRTPPAVVVLAISAPLLCLVPTWTAPLYAPAGQTFLGFRDLPGDHYQYAALIRQARDGHGLLLEDPFTSEPQRPSFVLPFFSALGVVARATGAAIPFVWRLALVVGGFLYVLAFHRLARVLLPGERHETLATALFALGGGLGWVVTVLARTVLPVARPIESVLESRWNWSTFGTLALPNWSWPAALLCLACRLACSTWRGKGPALFLVVVLLWFLHPYTGLATYGLFTGWLLVPVGRALLARGALPWGLVRERARTVAPALLSFAVVLAYVAWARTDPVFRGASGQGFRWTPSYSLGLYPVTYGLLLPLAALGLRAEVAPEARALADLVIAWLVVALALAVNPFYAGVKFQYLVFPPLALLATSGLLRLVASRPALAAPPAVLALALCLGLDAPVSVARSVVEARNNPAVFIATSELDAMTWLDGQPPGVVLGSAWAGNRLPWLAGKKVFAGHWFLTLDLDFKLRVVRAIFSPSVPLEQKRRLLRASGARWIYAGGAESVLGAVDPALPVREAYRNDGVTVYEVDRSRL